MATGPRPASPEFVEPPYPEGPPMSEWWGLAEATKKVRINTYYNTIYVKVGCYVLNMTLCRK